MWGIRFVVGKKKEWYWVKILPGQN
jgi:hypothetical protein